MAWWFRYQGNPVKAAHAIGADIISPYYTEISKQDVDEAHFFGMKVVPWTVNNEKDMNMLLSIDVMYGKVGELLGYQFI